jgi:hypothetical protein
MDFSDPITAALIGAAATVLTALVQLRYSWRRELKDRERGQPITKKTRRGPVIAVFVLLIAAGAGGFFLSQYVMSLIDEDRESLRSEVKSRLSEISASAARLEQARLNERGDIESNALRAEALRRGEEGVAASAVVGPCRGESGAKAESKSQCSEQTAVRMAVCASVPAAATVRDVWLYTRLEGSTQSWADSRVQAGQDTGQAKFVETAFERPESDSAKQVCHAFINWSGENSRVARILVKYTHSAPIGMAGAGNK